MVIEIGTRVWAGEADDREDGLVQAIEGDRALIAWRQGTRTWAQLADLEPAE